MSKMMNCTRKLRVSEVSGYHYKPVPFIRLKGKWLRDAGFNIGDTVLVNCEEGRLEIIWDAAAEKKESFRIIKESRAAEEKVSFDLPKPVSVGLRTVCDDDCTVRLDKVAESDEEH